MNLVWTGCDVLFATSYPKHSRKIKYVFCFCMHVFAYIADRFFIEKHVVVSEHLIEELEPLKLKKPIIVRENPVWYSEKFEKIPHQGFNVLYYRGLGNNQKFHDWEYGYDLIEPLKKALPEINIIEVNGGVHMSGIYPYIDFYIRPNNHDGNPRMIRECQINDIPHYHSYSNPNLNDMIDEIRKYL